MDHRSAENIPTQQFSNLPGGESIAPDYKSDFMACLQECLQKITSNYYNTQRNLNSPIKKDALQCYRSYVQSMKGGVNYSEETFAEDLDLYCRRQESFFRALNDLKKQFSKKGIEFEIHSPVKHYIDPFWDFGNEIGCTIQLNKTRFLSAYPPYPATTTSYMALTQAPVAANLIALTNQYMLFLGNDQDLDEPTNNALIDIIGQTEQGNAGEIKIKLARHYVLLEMETTPEENQINKIIQEHDIKGVLFSNGSNFTARIFLDEKIKIPTFLINDTK